MMLASTLSRPRWAMPSTISSNPLLAGLFDRQIQQRNQPFGPFERKALGPEESLLNEFLEDDGVGQAG